MVKIADILFLSALFAVNVSAAPQLVARAKDYENFPGSVSCPTTTAATTATTLQGTAVKNAVDKFTEGASKEGSYPKPYFLLGPNSKWPFASANACDNYKGTVGKLYEVPIGPTGQTWAWASKNSPGLYRVLYVSDGDKVIYCGMTVHNEGKGGNMDTNSECTNN